MINGTSHCFFDKEAKIGDKLVVWPAINTDELLVQSEFWILDSFQLDILTNDWER